MALAYLSATDAVAGSGALVADVGTSEFYEYRVGVRGDADALDRVDHVSALLRRPSGAGAGDSRFTLRLPRALLSRDAQDVQLWSFRDAQRNGPACSRVVSMRVAGLELDGHAGPGGPEPMSLSASNLEFRPCRQAGFSFEESAVSRAMFLDELLGALRALAPAVVDAAPSIVGAVTGGKQSADSDLVARLLQAVADALKPGEKKAEGAAGRTEPARPDPARAEPAKPGEQPAATAKPQSLVVSRGQAIDGGLITGPILAQLLGPVMEKAPQLLQVLTDKPLQFLTQLMEARQKAQVQKQQQQQQFIQGLLAEANRSMLLQELVRKMGAAGLAAAPAAQAESLSTPSRPAARPSERFHLAFEPGSTVAVAGTPRAVFRPSPGITLLCRVAATGAAPRAPLARAIVDVVLTDLEARRPVLTKSFHLTDVKVGAPLPLAFAAEELAGVPRHRDLHVAATMRWPARGGGLVSARGDHAIALADRHLLTELGGAAGPEVPLDDPTTYRSFWNRIWEGPGRLEAGKRWELDVRCRYYVRAALEHDSNARLETRLALDAPPDPSAVTYAMVGRMKSGLELSLDELNRLSPLVGGDLLAAEELAALRASALRPQLDLEATARLRMVGKRSEAGVVWVYPEVTLRTLSVSSVEETDANGQVTRVASRAVRFPLPSSVHFVTLRSS